MTTVRHFTATGFVVHEGATLLHWHSKVKMWLPPGGHVEENEDPVQAVLREVEEETGLKVVKQNEANFLRVLENSIQVRGEPSTSNGVNDWETHGLFGGVSV